MFFKFNVMTKITTVEENGVVSIVDMDTRIAIVFKAGNSLREEQVACIVPDCDDLKYSFSVKGINETVEKLIQYAEKRFPALKKEKRKRKRNR